jgi:probable HAF family extracellular repeat protein
MNKAIGSILMTRSGIWHRWHCAFIMSALIAGIFMSINSCDSYQPVSLQDSVQGVPYVELIDGAENSTITLTKGTDSYFRLEISNIDPNDHILPGLAKAWCIDWRTPISTGVHNGIRLHSSYGDKSLKPVNYLLNIKGALMAQDRDLTYKEIQVAIWSLLHYPEFNLNKIRADQLPSDMIRDGKPDFDRKKAGQIVMLVNSQVDSFEYNPSNRYAVVAETPSNTQTLIIEAGESVWAYGQHSFRSRALRDQLGITGRGKGQWGWIYELDSGSFSASTELIAGGGNDDGTLPADQVGTPIGRMELSKSGSSLKITFKAFPEYLLGDYHIWAGCSLDDFPRAGNSGNVAPGRFPHKDDGDPQNSKSFTVDLSELNCQGNIFIAAHAGVLYMAEGVLPPGKGELAFEMTDLSRFGLTGAMDINDHGHIIGGGSYWNSDTRTITTMPISGFAMNNNGQVVHRNYVWDQTTGLTEISYCCVPEKDNVHINAHDINNPGTVAGELEWEAFVFEDEEEGPVYDYEWFGFTWNTDQNANLIGLAYSTAWGINDHGTVTGTFAGGSFIDGEEIETPSTIYIDAYAVNNNRQVAGRAEVQSTSTILAGSRNPPSGKSGNNATKSRDNVKKIMSITRSGGVYDSGHVIEMLRNSTFRTDAFPWENTMMPETFGAGNGRRPAFGDHPELDQLLSTTQSSTLQGEAFIWDDQKGVQLLGNLGGQWATAWDINDQGQVVGYSDIGDNQHRAFYWDEEAGMVELPTYGGNSYARAINNKGQIVGYSYDDAGNFFPVQWTVTYK